MTGQKEIKMVKHWIKTSNQASYMAGIKETKQVLCATFSEDRKHLLIVVSENPTLDFQE